LPWQEPVSVAYDAAASDFDCRRAERLQLRPGGEDELLTLSAATAQQAPAGVGQFQPVCVQAGIATDSPAQEHRDRHMPVPIDGESNMAHAAAHPRDLGRRGTVE